MTATERKTALKKLNIPENNRVILSLDGGGVRGILTVQLLKELEKTAGIPLCQLADMTAGSSVGALIASLIALGYDTHSIHNTFKEFAQAAFQVRSPLAHRFINPPEFSKKNIKYLLKQVFKNKTLKDVSTITETDLLVTARDITAGEETFFSVFNHTGNLTGTYKNVLARGALEASISAPTYFHSFERFVDGGITAYNNPVMAAVIEALKYGPESKYSSDTITVISLGTGIRNICRSPDELSDPQGPDSLFWLKWLLRESGSDASRMQCDFLRTQKVFPGIDFRRFQLSLDADTIKKLPDIEYINTVSGQKERLHNLPDSLFAELDLAAVEHLDTLEKIGHAWCSYLHQYYSEKSIPVFGSDCVNETGSDCLISGSGDKTSINAHLSDGNWIDKH